MIDLISRQAAIDVPERFVKDCNPDHFVGHKKFIEFIDNAEIGSFGNWQFANGFNMGLTAAEVAIKNLPSAQPIDPVKHGEWVYKGARGRFPICECSACGNAENADWAILGDNVNYCPNCGAKMDGGKDDPEG